MTMLPTPLQARPTPARGLSQHLSDFLSGNREQIQLDWLLAVHDNACIPTAEVLPEPLLIDHVPKLLDSIIDLLRSDSSDVLTAEAVKDAEEHGVHRFEQRYDLSEMLRELCEFRGVLVLHVGLFENATADFAQAERILALARLHRFIDASARCSTTRFVREQQGNLVAANESRLRVMHTVGHELRNMMNGIAVATGILRRNPSAAVQEVGEMVRRNVREIGEVLDDLIELANLTGGKEQVRKSELPIEAFFEETVIPYWEAAAAKGLRLSLEIDPELRGIVCDVAKLKQIVINLLSNAIKYTETGHVRIGVAGLDSERWRFAVTDTGAGIAPEDHERIFSEFYRCEETRRAEGMGLGLAVATRLIDLLGGQVRVESERGRGSTFDVVLPRR